MGGVEDNEESDCPRCNGSGVVLLSDIDDHTEAVMTHDQLVNNLANSMMECATLQALVKEKDEEIERLSGEWGDTLDELREVRKDVVDLLREKHQRGSDPW